MKRCQSCGRLIELLEDFAGLDQSGNYCSSCADDQGKIKPFEEVLDNLTQRIAKTDGFDESASRNAALQILGRQPAWEPRFKREEKVKNNKKAVFLSLLVIVLVITSSVLTFLLSKPQVNFEQEYRKYLSFYDDPFSKKSIDIKNGLEITELKCKGNQEIDHLENGILQFNSIESVIKTKQNNNLSIVDRANFVINLDSGLSMKIEDFSRLSDDEQTVEKKNLNEVINGKIEELSWNFPRISFSGSLNQNEIDNLSYENFIKNAQTNIFTTKYNTKNNSVEYDYYPQTNQKDVIYKDKSVTLCVYPLPKNEYGLPSKILLYKNSNQKPAASFDIGENYAFFADKNGSNILIKLQNRLVSSFFHYALINIDNSNFVEQDDLYQSEKIKPIKGTCKIMYEDIFNMRKFVVIDLINNTRESVFQDDFNYTLEDIVNFNGNISLVLSKFSGTNSIEKTYSVFDLNSKRMTYLMKGNYSMVFSKGSYLVFTDYVQKASNNLPIDRNQKVRLMITNIRKPTITTLSNDVTVINNNSVFFDGTYFAWTKNAGSKDDQWKNVCYTKIPETK